MKNTYIAPRSMSSDQGLTFFFALFFLMFSGYVDAQATQDFSATPVGTNVYVDMGSGTVQHLLVNNMAPQTSPNAATSGASLGYQVLFTPTRVPSIGLTDGELFGAVDVTVPSSTDNDMGSLAIDFAANPPTGGNNNVYIMDDPDGLTTLRFNPVVVGAGSMFSMNYIIHNTSYENTDGVDDRVEIYLVNMANGQRTSLLSATNDQMENSETWQDLTADLTALEGQTMQLVVEFDVNSSSEEMAIDNISFSSGSPEADWPACVAPTEPVVAQTPLIVCPGVPFRLAIGGDLNSATEWVLYSDAEATQEVGRTSSSRFDVFGGAAPGTSYFVRGEGGCTTPGALTQIAITLEDAANCLPDATPGTSFEEPLGSSEDYFDTGDPMADHDLMNNQGQPTVLHNFKAQELGFTSQFLAQRSGTSGEAGLTDGDAFGVSNDASNAFPDGSQGLVLEDTDGRVIIRFSPIDLTGLSGVTVSFDYFVNDATYEQSATGRDNFVAAIINDVTGDEEVMINTIGNGSNGLPDLAVGEWTTFTYTLTRGYTVAHLAFAADFDSGSERVLIDNISFSAGTIICADTEAPVVTCPDPVSVDAGADCMATVDYPAATAFDDCSSTVAIAYSQDSGTTFPVGDTPVTVTATDESGKSSECTFNVTVNDVTPPTIICTDITVQLDSMENCTFPFTDTSFDPVATDNCGNASIFSNNTGVDISTLNELAANVETDGLNVIWVATDDAGLTSTCTQVITVINPPNCFTTSVTSQDASDFSAVRATPNPFTAGTTISFELPINTQVGIEILDLSGRVITADVIAPSGNNTYSWYWDAQQAALPAGTYFARLRAEGSVYTQRVVLMK